MLRKLKWVEPLQFGIVTGVMYALMSLIIVPFILWGAIAGAFRTPHVYSFQSIMDVEGLVFCVLVPFLYGLAGFIFGALAAWIYNVVAKWTGGIEFEVK